MLPWMAHWQHHTPLTIFYWRESKISFNVIVPNESKLTVATCNWTIAINQIQTTCDGVNGGTQPCIWLAHATSGNSLTNNLTYLPSTMSWMTDSMCWIGQEYWLASDVQRWLKKQQAWGKSLCRLNCHWCMQGNASPQAMEAGEKLVWWEMFKNGSHPGSCWL